MDDLAARPLARPQVAPRRNPATGSRPRCWAALVIALVIACVPFTWAPSAEAVGGWTWPVTGVVVRGYDPPLSPYGSGHRGIDIAAPVGTAVRAPSSGVVTFAGRVGGQLFLTIDHGGGLLATMSWLSSVQVRKGDLVREAQVVAASGSGHPDDLQPSLHFGVRLGGAYVNPLDYLSPLAIGELIRLAPLGGP